MTFIKKHKKRIYMFYLTLLFVYSVINVRLLINDASKNEFLIYNGVTLCSFLIVFAGYKYFSDTLETLAFMIILVGFCIPLSIILFRDYLLDKWKLDELGPIGDLIGGSTISFLTLASILLIIETIRTQRNEMQESRKEFEEQTIQMEKQNYNSEVYFIHNNKINYIQNLSVAVSDDLVGKLGRHEEVSNIVRRNEIKGADILELIYYTYDNVIDFSDFKNEIIKIYYKSIPYLFNQNNTLFELSMQYYTKNIKISNSNVDNTKMEYIENNEVLSEFKISKEAKNLVLNMDYFERKIMIKIAEQNSAYNEFQTIKEESIILKDKVNTFRELLSDNFSNYKKIVVKIDEEKQRGFNEMDMLEVQSNKLMKKYKELRESKGDFNERLDIMKKIPDYQRKQVQNEFYHEWIIYNNNLEKLKIINDFIDVKNIPEDEKYRLIYSALEIENIKKCFLDSVSKIEKYLHMELKGIRHDISRIPNFYSELVNESDFDFSLIEEIEKKIKRRLLQVESTFDFNFLSEEIAKIITLIPYGMKDVLSHYNYFGE
ncbi:hypothetical protein ACIQ2D_08535 [Lysinibacillus sp. NPDC097287]|uniref:hypothetical protein n=1 Tax=Lysinibacillus sp. NPDC097287 TaxID=3364144 RepID=UPI003827D293